MKNIYSGFFAVVEGVLLLALGYILFVEHNPLQETIEDYPIITTGVYLLLYILLLRLLARFFLFYYAKRNNRPFRQVDNFYYGIVNILRVLVFLGVLASIFSLLGVEFKTLLTSMSIVAAALAILSKEYINDFLAGIYYSFSRNFEIGEYVRMGEHSGTVVAIDLFKIKVLNDDDDLLILPNSKVYSSEIVNYTRRNHRLISMPFELALTAVDSMEKLEDELRLTLADFSKYIEKESYRLRVDQVKKDAIDFRFEYRLMEMDLEVQRDIRRATNRKIFNFISKKS